MTCREKMQLEHPDFIDSGVPGGVKGCPHNHLNIEKYRHCNEDPYSFSACLKCWDREIPEEDTYAGDNCETDPNDDRLAEIMGEMADAQERLDELNKYVKSDIPHILDSGERREFESGAVRDIQEGKGRCDLLPLDVVAEIMSYPVGKPYPIFMHIHRFKQNGDTMYLYCVITEIVYQEYPFSDACTMLLEVSKHFEEGAKKYGEHNWQKGIPTHCYIDSAVRHYLKHLRGDKDEPHDRAFVWNILCCIWTCIHKPEFNDYLKTEASNDTSN